MTDSIFERFMPLRQWCSVAGVPATTARNYLARGHLCVSDDDTRESEAWRRFSFHDAVNLAITARLATYGIPPAEGSIIAGAAPNEIGPPPDDLVGFFSHVQHAELFAFKTDGGGYDCIVIWPGKPATEMRPEAAAWVHLGLTVGGMVNRLHAAMKRSK